MKQSVDIAIIGAGTAGLSAYKEASKFTNNIVLIDQGPLGTTCARVGCMPSKLFIHAANSFHARAKLDELGITGAQQLQVSLPKVMQRVRQLRDYFTKGVVDTVESLDNFIHGSAKFIDQHTLQVGQQIISAKKIIIASGTQSIMPTAWDAFADKVLTNDNFFEQTDFTGHLAVIGAGVIGVELGQALARLGVKTTIISANQWVGSLTDPLVNDYAIKLLQQEMPLLLNQRANVSASGSELLIKTDQTSFSANKILAAMGRNPSFKQLNLAAAGIELNDKGLPDYDQSTMQIKNSAIFIAGDADKTRPLLHEAADEGRIAGYNAAQTQSQCFQRRVPLRIVFSDPQIAVVGCDYANIDHEQTVIGEIDFADQGRARVMQKNAGLLRVYVDKQNGQLRGAEMIAPAAEHLAHLLAWAIQQNMTVFDALQMPFYHPVVEEGLRTALRHAATQVTLSAKPAELAMCDSESIATTG